jgi:hypothetical protein
MRKLLKELFPDVGSVLLFVLALIGFILFALVVVGVIK